MTLLPYFYLCLFSISSWAGGPLARDARAPSTDAETTTTGLAYQVLTQGHGIQHPLKNSTVTVHYTGWQASDGVQFDSSVDRGQPLTMALNQVIKGWTEGVQLMRVGETTRFWIPANLAYGNGSVGGRPSGLLIFDVSLLDIAPEPVKLETPPLTVSSEATTTASGLAYLVLKKGKGKEHPKRTDIVDAHYSAWQASNGHLFDSTVVRGQSISFPLNQVIKGLTEGLTLMVAGETARFWIPADLAYGHNGPAGRPAGLLIFDVELLNIRK